jgi:hypothetical protein
VLVARKVGGRVLDHYSSEHSQQSRSTIAVTPALETDHMAAVQAALAEERTAGWHQRITFALRSPMTRNFALRHSV